MTASRSPGSPSEVFLHSSGVPVAFFRYRDLKVVWPKAEQGVGSELRFFSQFILQ